MEMASLTRKEINDGLEEFIFLVQKQPHLYCNEFPAPNLKEKRRKAWASIAEKMNWDVETCKRKWRTIRTYYVNHRGPINWSYYDNLRFLDPYISKKDHNGVSSNFESIDSNDDSSLMELFGKTDEVLVEGEIKDDDNQRRNGDPFEAVYPPPTENDNQLSSTNLESVEKNLKSYISKLMKMSQTPPPKKRTKHDPFFEVAGTLLDQLPADVQDNAKMHILNYIHKLSKTYPS